MELYGGNIIDASPQQEPASVEDQLISLAASRLNSPQGLLPKMISQMEESGAEGHLYLASIIPEGGNGVVELDRLQQSRVRWLVIKMLAGEDTASNSTTFTQVVE